MNRLVLLASQGWCKPALEELIHVGVVPLCMMTDGLLQVPVVLLVEDEPLVQVLACDVLEEAGFPVLEAWNADEALQLLEAHSDQVQVLFTDVDLPGSMDGIALAEQVHARWPHILLLLASGYARPHADDIPDDGRFIPKPYRPDTVVRHIKELIASH